MNYFTLIPSALYREEDKDLWLNFLRDTIPHDQQLQTESFPEFECVLVEEVTHVSIISQLLHKAATSGNGYYLHWQEGCLTMVIVSDEKLLLANNYAAPTETDALYYLTNAIQQLELSFQLPVHLLSDSLSLRELLQTYYQIA